MDDGNSITSLNDTPDQMASLVTAQAMDTLFCDSLCLTNLESNILQDEVSEDIVHQAIDAIMDSLPHVRNDDAIVLIKNNGIYSLP